MVDYVVIGGGVIGSFMAYELTQFTSKIIVIEKEEELGQVQTKHNSALIHSPLLVPPNKGKLKSKLAQKGNTMYQTLVDEFNVPHLKNGALILASNDKEMAILEGLYAEGKQRGIDSKLLTPTALQTKEQHLSKSLKGALSLPSAMTADTFALCKTLEKASLERGVKFHKNTEVIEITYENNMFVVKTNHQENYKTTHIINAAGVHAETIANMLESHVPYKTHPHKGEYLVLPKTYKDFVKHTLFPVPQKTTKGVLVIPQPDGTIRLGPTSNSQKDLDQANVTQEGIEEIKKTVNMMLESVPYHTVERTYAGIRSTINTDDFYIHRSKEYPNFIHVAGIDSPGVTAAPAIAKYVTEDILNLTNKKL